MSQRYHCSIFILLLLSVTILSSRQAVAREWGTADQRQWEEAWRQLKFDRDNAPTEAAQQLLTADLRALKDSLQTGDHLVNWHGTLAALRFHDDDTLGTMIVGLIKLSGPTTQTPHTIYVYAPLSRSTEQLREIISRKRKQEGALYQGALVAFSGTIDRNFVEIRRAMTFREIIAKLFRENFGYELFQEAREGASFKPELELNMVLTDISFLENSDVVERSSYLQGEMERVKAALDQASADQQEASRYSCEDFQALFDYGPCPQFLMRARNLGVDCPLRPGIIEQKSKPTALWYPQELMQRYGNNISKLSQIAKAAKDRFSEDHVSDLKSIEEWISTALDVSYPKLDDYRYVLECLHQKSEEDVIISSTKTPALEIPSEPYVSPEPTVALNDIIPSKGFTWQMNWQDVKNELEKLSVDVDAKPQDLDDILNPKSIWGKPRPLHEQDHNRIWTVKTLLGKYFIDLPVEWKYAIGDKYVYDRNTKRLLWIGDAGYIPMWGFNQTGSLRAMMLVLARNISEQPSSKNQFCIAQWNTIVSNLIDKYGLPQAGTREFPDPALGTAAETEWKDKLGNRIVLSCETTINNEADTKKAAPVGYLLRLLYLHSDASLATTKGGDF